MDNHLDTLPVSMRLRLPKEERRESVYPISFGLRGASQADATRVNVNQLKNAETKSKGMAGQIGDRLLVIPSEGFGKFHQYNRETFGQRSPYRDVFRERFGESNPAYPRLLEMADSIGDANNTWYWSLGNKRRKETLRKAFDNMGIERKY
jgi:hypothetical protein